MSDSFSQNSAVSQWKAAASLSNNQQIKDVNQMFISQNDFFPRNHASPVAGYCSISVKNICNIGLVGPDTNL